MPVFVVIQLVRRSGHWATCRELAGDHLLPAKRVKEGQKVLVEWLSQQQAGAWDFVAIRPWHAWNPFAAPNCRVLPFLTGKNFSAPP
jgi:hypothetical protein